MNFAKNIKNEPIACVLGKYSFTFDESKFEMFGVKKPQKIWQSVNEEFNDKCVTETVIYGGGRVMVRGCIAASGVGNFVLTVLTMKKEDYRSILQRNVEKFGLEGNWIFQQYNDPKHSSKIVKELLLY